MKKLFLLASFTFAAIGCKPNTSSEVRSGLGGSPGSYTCNELKTEFDLKKTELQSAISNFSKSYNSLQDANRLSKSEDKPSKDASSPNSPQDAREKEGAIAVFTLDDQGVISKIGEGNEAPPSLPEPVAGFKDIPRSMYHKNKNVVECDEVFAKFNTSTDTQILEQCRYLVEVHNFVQNVQYEYNWGRNGECRSGKAVFQQNQTSSRYPYCDNPCRFGQTPCVKCNFSIAGVSSHYICGDEQDARLAVDQQCKNSHASCTGQAAQCEQPKVYNDIQGGTTSNRESDTYFKVERTVGALLEAEASAGVSAKITGETSFNVMIDGHMILKNSRGSEITTVNGGETASTVACSISVKAAVVAKIGGEVGAGFDLVVAKGKVVAKAGTNFEAATVFKETSRDIPAAGSTLSNMVLTCTKFAEDWATSTLPNLIQRNAAVKVVASRFMGEERDADTQDISGKKIFCESSVGGTTTDKKTYRINKMTTELTQDGIYVSVVYDGYYNFVDRTSTRTHWKKGAMSRYVEMREKIFKGGTNGLSDADMRYMIKGSYVSGDDTFTDCSKTAW